MPTGTGFWPALAAALASPREDDAPLAFRRLDLPAPRAVLAGGRRLLVPEPGSLRALAREAFLDLNRHLPRGRLEAILAARAAASNEGERLVLDALAANAVAAAETGLPLCQDTGVASAWYCRGEDLLAGSPSGDEEELALGAADAYREGGFRASVVAPRDARSESNTRDNLPLAAELRPVPGASGALLFAAKGGGSSNRTTLHQETPALLEPAAFDAFLSRAVAGLGVAACPPYRIAVAVGGLSPEETLAACKLAAAGALDPLPPAAAGDGTPIRLREAEARVLELAAASGWGAQFGGSRLALDARVVRLARHAASLPVAVGVSCSAHRRAFGRIDRDGFFLEDLERSPGLVLAGASSRAGGPAEPWRALPGLDLGGPSAEALAGVRALRAGGLVAVSGPLVLARDAAHARLAAMAARGEHLPAWALGAAILYAGPTEASPGAPAGALGPTTAKRMDTYLEALMSRGASLLSIGKGERSAACADACARHGGAYLAVPGGTAALFGSRFVESMETLDWPELGMEAVRRVVVRGLPALVAVDSSGSDVYAPLRDRR